MEILVGNSDDTSHPSNFKILPGTNPRELEKLQQVGESAYMTEKQQEAKRLVQQRPMRYAGLTLRRILNTWTGIWEFPPPWNMDESGWPNVLMYSFISMSAFAGMFLALRERMDLAYPLILVVLVFPAVYYLTHSDMGFRHPIDPILVTFIACGFSFRKKESPI